MNQILIPMAGEGSRFVKEGYLTPKPLIPITNWRNNQKIPMVIAATLDLPGATDPNTKLLYIDRAPHQSLYPQILSAFPHATFLTLTSVTSGQATTVLQAKPLLDLESPLLIGACDNGAVFDENAFNAKKEAYDVIVITHSGDTNIAQNPTAHSWVQQNEGGVVTSLSIKTPISTTPGKDHATTGLFWFKRAGDCMAAIETMIEKNDQTGGEFYLDNAINFAIQAGARVGYVDIHYLCWGTPKDYQAYEQTLAYYQSLMKTGGWCAR